jgi:ABC-type transport system substrate-binding protein
MESSGSSVPETQPLVEAKKAVGGPRALLVILVVIIVVLAGALAYVSWRLLATPTPTPSGGTFSVQALQPTGVQGQPLGFVVSNLRPGAKARVSFGDGQVLETGASSFNYTYTTPGNYLVRVQQFIPSNGTVVSDYSGSLFKVTIVPDVPSELSQFVSVPTLYFNTTLNPTAPIVAVNTPVYLYGNYTEISQLLARSVSHHDNTTNITDTETVTVAVDHYAWDFGNGQTMTVPADPATFYPVTNPVSVRYGSSGLFTATFTLFTAETLTTQIYNGTSNITISNTNTINSYSITLGTTVAVGNFAIAKYRGVVPSPGVITEVINSPGGPFSFDPQIDYETVGYEVIVNTQGTLLFYDGASTTNWFPYLASDIPTVANGGITDNFKTYSFHLRPDVAFSNGDPVTAYDVWYSTIRSMLFQGGEPGTADWIISQYLIPRDAPPFFSPFVPIVNATNKATAFAAITGAVTYSNATNNVTFHLVSPTPPSLFFTAISFPLGMGILDAAWLKTVGADITFTPDGFLAYQDQSKSEKYNTQVQLHPVASGPFEINTYVPSTAVVLTPNPHFPGIPKIPKQNNTVILQWVASPAVAYQLYISGQGDIVTLLPPPYYKALAPAVAAGQTIIHGPFPSITEFFDVFNVNIATSLIPTAIGPGYSIPSDYFANPLVREAFSYAFNYTNYVDNVLGNKKYGYNFGSAYCGVIVQGLPYYVPPSNLTGCPNYDLNRAKSLLYQSGMYNVSVNFPIVIPTGDTTDFTASIVFAQALASIDPNIVMSPVYLDFSTIIGLSVPGANPMPFYFLGWIADYPYPSDYTDAMYLEGGTYPGPNGWSQGYLDGLAATHPTQAALYNAQASAFRNLTAQIKAADTQPDPTLAAQKYAQAEQTAVGLYMYTYMYQATGFWIVKPWISPYQGDWGYQTNPTIGAGADSVFFWWVKG